MNISHLTIKKFSGILFLITIITSLSQFSIAQNNSTGSARLIEAVKRNNVEFARFLIKSGADVNFDLRGFMRSPLMWAAVRGEMDMVRFLVEAEADVNSSNPDNNETALRFAIRGGRIEVIAYLVEVGEADISFQEIIYAIKLGNVDIDVIEYLASQVNNIDEQDAFGSSALMHAALYGEMDTVKFLVEEAGANIHLKDSENASAIIYAVEGGYTDIADYLIEKGTEGFVRFICRTTTYSLCNQLIN